MRPEDIKEQELNEEQLDEATGGTESTKKPGNGLLPD